MFAKMAAWLGKAFVLVLAVVGVMAVVVVWNVAAWLKAWGEPIAPQAGPVAIESRAVVESVPVVGASCLCSSGSVCVGPRGGRYCETESGQKRYR